MIFVIRGGVAVENKILNDKLFEAFASSSDNVYVYVTDLQNGLSRWSKNSVEYFNFPDAGKYPS